MQGEHVGITLQATALVSEAWLKLVGEREEVQFKSRGHFFVSAAEAMRQILVDAARSRKAAKRGGGLVKQDVDKIQLANLPPDEKLIQLDEALTIFETKFPVKGQLVKLRYFNGMTIAEASKMLDISPATAERYWAFARVWLKQRLSEDVD